MWIGEGSGEAIWCDMGVRGQTLYVLVTYVSYLHPVILHESLPSFACLIWNTAISKASEVKRLRMKYESGIQ